VSDWEADRPVDVFVSAKDQDHHHARRVYDFLRRKGLRVFLSRESLPDLGDSDYRRQIEKFLDQTTHLVVVTSSSANATSGWVEFEWGAFHNEKLSNRKSGNLITLLAGPCRPQDLPLGLRIYQSLRLDDDGLEELLSYVANPTNEKLLAPASRAPDPIPSHEPWVLPPWVVAVPVGIVLAAIGGAGGGRLSGHPSRGRSG
jgi:hypothetical protein